MKYILKILDALSGPLEVPECEVERVFNTLSEVMRGGDVADVRQLLRDEKVALQSPTCQARSLRAAVIYRRTDVVTAFVDAGWSVDEATNNGLTALSLAVAHGNAEFVQFLLGLGAAVNIVDKLGNTPLTWAAGFLDWLIVDILKDAGALVTCREAALLGDNDAMLRAIEVGKDIDAIDCTGYTLLHLAATNAHHATVSMLLEMGYDANVPVRVCPAVSPLYLAIRALPYSCRFAEFIDRDRGAGRAPWADRQLPPLSAYRQVVDLLIRRGASELAHALEKAIEFDNPTVFDLLLPKTRLCNTCFTPLTYAVDLKRPDCVKRMIEIGEDVNGGPSDPRCSVGRLANPVNAAVWNLIQELPSARVRGFGETGAQVSGYEMWVSGAWPDKSWRANVFEPERHRKLMAMLSTLLDAGAVADSSGALFTAAERGHSGAVELLLRFGVTVHAGEAVLFGSTDMLLESIKRGDDVELSSWEGHTALMMAAAVGNGEAVELLLGNGADVNAATDTGWTPLMYATKAGNVALVRLLLACGSRTDAVRNGDDTPMSLAKATGDRAVLSELRQTKSRRGAIDSWSSVKK